MERKSAKGRVERFGTKRDGAIGLAAKWRTPSGERCVVIYAWEAVGGEQPEWYFCAMQSLAVEALCEPVASGTIYGGENRVAKYLKGLREGIVARARRKLRS